MASACVPQITSGFEGGNIEVVSADRSDEITLRLREDTNSHHKQWFYFRVTAEPGMSIRLKLVDMQSSSYPDAWFGYSAVVSDDEDEWVRAPTQFADGVLTIDIHFTGPRLSVAYFAPYSVVRKDWAVSRALGTGRFGAQILGTSIEGRDMECLTFGSTKKDAHQVWIIARQHPGEAMASWWMEGALEMLSDPTNPIANELMKHATFHIVPMMNPDGVANGNLRVNSAGIDLNRAWMTPHVDESPEVYCVLQKMKETGCDLFLDVHGDEGLPYNFIAGFEGTPSASSERIDRLNAFKLRLSENNPDFQTQHGYPVPSPNEADLTIANNMVAEQFGALSMTLEMPFKDSAISPDAQFGWSPDRAKNLAHSCLQTIFQTVRPG